MARARQAVHDDWETALDEPEPIPAIQQPAQRYTITSNTPQAQMLEAAPKMVILQRPSSASSNKSTQSNGTANKEKTLEQRQQDYKQARERIFGTQPEAKISAASVTLTRLPVQPPADAQGFNRKRPPSANV